MNNKLSAFKDSRESLLKARDYILSAIKEGDFWSVDSVLYNRETLIDFLRPQGDSWTYIKWKDGLRTYIGVTGSICRLTGIGSSSLMMVYYDLNTKDEVMSRLAVIGLINE